MVAGDGMRLQLTKHPVVACRTGEFVIAHDSLIFNFAHIHRLKFESVWAKCGQLKKSASDNSRIFAGSRRAAKGNISVVLHWKIGKNTNDFKIFIDHRRTTGAQDY